MFRENLLGSWLLQRWEWRSLEGERLWFATESLSGLLTYSPEGHMTAELAILRGANNLASGATLAMRIRHRWVSTFGVRFQYSGRFELDAAGTQLRHYVERRSWQAPKQPILERDCSLREGSLCLEFSSREIRDRLLWRRASDAQRG